MKEKINKIVALLNKRYFNCVANEINDTLPIQYVLNPEVKVVTMLSHGDINMYLIAIKSFMSNFGYGSIEVIDDGTLTDSDIDILMYHVPGINVYKAKDVNTFSCPAYISWKRLFRIADLARNSYVIQLDSDTISLSPLIDVHDKVNSNEGFLIGNDLWRQPVEVNFLHNIVKKWRFQHAQPKAEEIFCEIDFFKDGTKYLRGCAGFAGYPKNFSTFDEIINLSEQIEKRIGEIWHTWGSEQVTSMCLISKTRNSSILPWPKYRNYMFPKTNESIESAAMIHFIGSTRYVDGQYSKLVKKYMEKIRGRHE